MKRARVVIGAGFGDEGKGLVTDYLAHESGGRCVVVRHNGGAQAGHTVVTPEGRRHVFHHIGSGTLAGAATYLSRYFICNPLLFRAECEALQKPGTRPAVFVAPEAPVTTPYDMMINQIVEESRGVHRHGSCGVGIGETVERSLHPAFVLRAGNLGNPDILRARMNGLRAVWVPHRLKNLGVTELSRQWVDRLFSDDIIEGFIAHTAYFNAHTMRADPDFLQRCEDVVFEGAQGLLLDQAHGYFPHVTRSHTGIRNALALAAEAGLREAEVFYATRAYATRHGQGPLPHEVQGLPHAGIVDETNRPNAYQGSLRFGRLDLDLLAKSIACDLRDAPASFTIRHSLVMTCLDQIGGAPCYVADGRVQNKSEADFLALAQAGCGADRLFVSRGPTRAHVAQAGLATRAPFRNCREAFQAGRADPH